MNKFGVIFIHTLRNLRMCGVGLTRLTRNHGSEMAKGVPFNRSEALIIHADNYQQHKDQARIL